MNDAPDRIRVAQDSDGFWTCREAVSGSQEYVRADKVDDLIETLRSVTASLVAAHSLLSRSSKKAAPSDNMFDQMLIDYQRAINAGRSAIFRHGEIK